MYETISKAMTSTLANHNEMFLNGITNAIKEDFSPNIQNMGPTYSIPVGTKQILLAKRQESMHLGNH